MFLMLICWAAVYILFFICQINSILCLFCTFCPSQDLSKWFSTVWVSMLYRTVSRHLIKADYKLEMGKLGHHPFISILSNHVMHWLTDDGSIAFQLGIGNSCHYPLTRNSAH
jgi:hypothetical protein